MAYVVSAPAVAPVTSATLTPNLASPQIAGASITFKAAAFGGVGPRQFKFFVQPSGGSAQVVRDWDTSPNSVWTPATAGNYTVSVWARSAGVTADAPQAAAQLAYVVTVAPLQPVTLTSLTSDLAAPQSVLTSVTFTAAAAGGNGSYQFKWWISDGSTWTLARDWSSAPTFVWTPTTAGAYRVGVWARAATSTADDGSVNYSVSFRVKGTSTATPTPTPTPTPPPPAEPLTIISLMRDLSNRQAPGTTVTFTATATGGTAPYQYKWWIFDGVSWTLARDWSTSPSYAWTPTLAGGYRIGVWVRDATTTADDSTVNYSVAYRVK
jgi:hypothetical protein